MSYDEKLEAFRRVLQERGERQFRFVPPIYPFLRKIGLHPVPPIFRPFWRNAIFFGCVSCPLFALIHGVALLIGWQSDYHGPLDFLISSVLASAALSLVLSGFVEWRKEQVYFGEWDSIGAQFKQEPGDTTDGGEPNKAAEPSRTPVTPPSEEGDRASGAPGPP